MASPAVSEIDYFALPLSTIYSTVFDAANWYIEFVRFPSSKVLLFFWCLFGGILVMTYDGLLRSSLLTPQYEKPINTIQGTYWRNNTTIHMNVKK
jgi:hypothetical protein